MRKIAVIIFVLVSISANAQIVNKFRDSTWFKSGVRFDSTLFFTKGAGSGKVLTSDANGRATWQTFSSAGVTQGALDDSISAVRAIRKVDTIYKNLDSIVFKINGIRYSVLDSTGGGIIALQNDTLYLGSSGVYLPYIPLSGTVSGSPVTGDIEFNDYKRIYNNSGVADTHSELNFDDGNFFISQTDLNTNDIAQLQIQSISPDTRIVVKTTGINGKGIEGDADYSANYTDFTYTQKNYVDKAVKDTASVLRGLIPNVSNFATITNLADTSTALRSLISAKVSTTTLTDSLAKKTNRLISFNTYTTSDTLRLSDADKVIEMNVGTANNLVIPNYSDYAFPVGTQITLIQIGAGQTTLVPASGVTVRSASSKRKLSGQYSGATLIEKAPNEWYLFGDITN